MSLKETQRTEKRNVVLIHLESTRARSVTPYNENLETTPFMNELAKSSLLAERHYTTVPRTSKAIISVNCGIQPHLVEEITEARQGGIPSRGLADLLKEQRYSTAFFQSSTENFENFRDLVENFGYAEYYPLEALDDEYKEGFEWANYFGYEDDIMLRPSREWLRKQRAHPFMVKYLTGTGHHDYRVPSTYCYEHFADEEPLNSYLNCLRYQDRFVKNLID
jgi:lipoteichoic acid synthase